MTTPNPPKLNTPVMLYEDDLYDLLWLVDNYGHKLTEVADYISAERVAYLSKTLETMAEGLG
jgi:hypothetical protein